MSILSIVTAIILATLRCVNSDVGNGDVSNYFSSYISRDQRNPTVEGVSAGDVEKRNNEKKGIVQNEIMPEFSNFNLPQQLKSALLNDYYFTKPYTRGDLSNLYNLDLLGSGLVDFNARAKSNNLWPPRPNYTWVNRNFTWPILWHRQFPRSDSFSNLDSLDYNLGNNHVNHSNASDKNDVISQPPSDLEKSIGFETGNIKMFDNGLSDSTELQNKSSKDFSGPIGNKFEISAFKLVNNSALEDDSNEKLKNLTSKIVQHLPNLSDIYVSQRESDLTKLFNSFNTSSLLNKYENSERSFQ